MAFLIAAAGLSGSGKSTALQHLRELCAGEIVYLGGIVLEQIRERGVVPCPENGRSVRLDIRRQHGPAALAILAAPVVERYLNDGINVLIDAIFAIDEYRELQRLRGISKSALFAVNVSFETRCGRLCSRTDRPLTLEQVKERDKIEIATLRTAAVIAEADYTIINEYSMETFQNNLERFWKKLTDSTL